jgi:acyl-coenzyme A synthetase/AMP-(fatty) acid ligase
VPTGRSGEIVVRSAALDSEYWGMPEKTADSFFAGGWFRTGDIGHFDTEGYLTYSDRAIDAISTSHGAVYPHEVETAVLRHAAVANCGLVGDGVRVVAAVLLKDGYTDSPALREEIAVAARPGLAEHEIPEIEILASLPTVLGGAKVQRSVLRDQLLGVRQ